jgi:hypothetical protein
LLASSAQLQVKDEQRLHGCFKCLTCQQRAVALHFRLTTQAGSGMPSSAKKFTLFGGGGLMGLDRYYDSKHG